MNKIRKILETIVILFILFFNINIVKSSENVSLSTKSEAFKRWENLSEEERNNSIQPSYSDVSFKDSVRRSTYNDLLRANNNLNLESRYNLKNVLNNIIVKDQKQVGACWAFSASTVFETTMAKKYNINNMEYSPMHIDYKTSEIFNRKAGSGGNIFMALAYSTSGYGPVYEIDFPFNSVYDEQKNEEEKYYLTDIKNVNLDKKARIKVENATMFANIYKVYSDNSIIYKDSASILVAKKYSNEEIEAVRKLIKQHIKEDGAVTASFYADSSGGLSNESDYISTYYNIDNNAYYCDMTRATPNHAVTIIGWDDTFSKEKFAEGHKPLNDGAYIVLNSWGSKFGDNGYFYVSYDDVSIEQDIVGVSSIKQINDGEYEKIYEYDELGINYNLNAVNDDETEYLGSIYAANVFSRENVSNKYEYLSEIGIFLGNTEGVQIYVNPSDGDLNKGELVATYTGANALNAGYHTVKLASPILLTGSKFAIKIKYSNSEITQIPIECNLYDSGLTDIKDNIYSTAKSNAGESYISKDGNNWTDLSNYTIEDYEFKNSNVCIKAFSTYSDKMLEIPVTSIKLDKNQVNLDEGDTLKLTVLIEPENVTNKSVIWETSNDSVAIVENGIVRAVSSGVATIVVKTEDGKYSDSCFITVQKTKIEEVQQEESQQTEKQEEQKLNEQETIKDEEISIKVTGIKLNTKTYSMQVGDSSNLVATIEPQNATNKNVEWTSSDESVATISKRGIITAINVGTTTITVKSDDGNYTAQCTVTVTNKTNSDDDIYESSDEIEKNISNSLVGQETQPVDTTKASVTIPYAGKTRIIVAIIIIGIISIIIHLRYRNLKDIQ